VNPGPDAQFELVKEDKDIKVRFNMIVVHLMITFHLAPMSITHLILNLNQNVSSKVGRRRQKLWHPN
jgi:hypothetical protein